MNVNSLRYKFSDLSEMLQKDLVDIFVISETKLDETFSNALFAVRNFSTYRCDRNARGGGVIIFVNSAIPHCINNELTSYITNGIEGMVLEFTLGKCKWFLSALYKPPAIKNSDFENSFVTLHDNLFTHSQNIITVGDLNFDMNKENKLHDLMTIFNLKNIISGSTCNKGDNPTSLDVLLVSRKASFLEAFNTDIGISDHHSMIGCAMRSYAPRKVKHIITYRSYKHFSDELFISDLNNVALNDVCLIDDVDDKMSTFDSRFNTLVEKHAPMKRKTIRNEPCPFMNGALRKAIFKKQVLRNRYYNVRNNDNWELFRKQRNYVTKLRKSSVKKYFETKCKNNNREFWKMIKPFYSNKGSNTNGAIILRESDKLLTNDKDVCESFNHFFTNAAENIGFSDEIPFNLNGEINIDDVLHKHMNHESIVIIKRHNEHSTMFDFNHASATDVYKIMNTLSVKKAMGCDNIPAKIIKLCSSVLSPVITNIINKCIDDGIFPSKLKYAEICSIHKKCDRLVRENYRPISLLRIISKVFERVFAQQVTCYFDSLFTPFLSAYRKGYGCHDLLLKFVEDWRSCLDDNVYSGAILMDLSKAFDCLPHCLLICKLHAYGFSRNACSLMTSYLCSRFQRVKLNTERSSWQMLRKGVPQGSILGPILFNVFIHDLFYFIKFSRLFNYADDDTLFYSHTNLETVVECLTIDADIAVNWFIYNGMKANPNKFQAIISHRNASPHITFKIAGADIISQSSVTLLGVQIDQKLNFKDHITKLCKQAAKQINVLKRLSNLLDRQSKLLIYNSFISSVFNYSPLVWSFTTKGCITMIEKINERALRFVLNDNVSNYATLLIKAKKDSFVCHRNKLIAQQVYKSLNKISPPYLWDLFERKLNTYDLRDNNLVIQPKVCTVSHGLLSVKYHGSKIWNKLPVEYKSSLSFNDFKRRLKTSNENPCKCSYCV